MRPNETKLNLFIIFGMPRTGTTYLYHNLAKHPSFFVPYRKESHFFTVNYDNGFDWFNSLYKGIAKQQLAADINPIYYLDPRSEKRILQYDPKIKLILGVRDPTEFAVSLYGNVLAHGLKPPAITEFVQGFNWTLSTHESLEFSLLKYPMRRRISELCKTFSEKILLYDYRCFEQDPLSILQKVERFLEVPSFFTEDNVNTQRINASGRRNPLLMNALLANPKFLESIYRMLPKTVIRYCKVSYDRMIARGSNVEEFAKKHKTNILSQKEADTLKGWFEEDTIFYKKLFEHSTFVLGDGSLF